MGALIVHNLFLEMQPAASKDGPQDNARKIHGAKVATRTPRSEATTDESSDEEDAGQAARTARKKGSHKAETESTGDVSSNASSFGSSPLSDEEWDLLSVGLESPRELHRAATEPTADVNLFGSNGSSPCYMPFAATCDLLFLDDGGSQVSPPEVGLRGLQTPAAANELPDIDVRLSNDNQA